jgi:putative hydrolase of the HAD superfamily
MNFLLWDFDDTLAYRKGGMWASALQEIINKENPHKPITQDQIKPFLQFGFPWQTPEKTHIDIKAAEQWWNSLDDIFINAFIELGFEDNKAKTMAKKVREIYPKLEYWNVFEDTLPVLKQLSDEGWKHIVISNHVPELRKIIDYLNLNRYIQKVYISAETGYEKPNKQAFYNVTKDLEQIDKIWMIGDNIEVDIRGAENVGIPAILVRKFHKDAKHYCESLLQIPEII